MAVRQKRTQISRNLSLSAAQRSEETSREIKTRARRLGQSAFVALIVSMVLLFSAGVAVGQSLQVVGVSGAWENTNLTSGGAASGEGTDSIRWGDPATSSGQSGYDFDAANLSSIGPGSPVSIGQFTHLNFPIYPPSLDSAELVISIEFDDDRLTQSVVEIRVPFTHDETGNGDDPCAYPEGPNQNGCADAVFIGSATSDFIIVGGIECEVTVWFGNGTTRYLTAEEEANTIDLYLQFSCPSFNPLLTIEKSGPATANIGDTVTYTLDVTHAVTSDGSPVGNVSVTDSIAGIASLTGKSGGDQDDYLEDGETWSYQVTYTIQADDPHALINEACVEGLDIDEDLITACDTHTTTVPHAPVIVVEKTADVATASVGDTVNYTVNVSHAPSSDGSPVDVTSVIDSLGISLTGPTGDDGDGLLEGGETWTYVGAREVLPNDPRNLLNEVCVEGVDLDGDSVSDCGDTTTIIEHNPALLVQKSGSLASGQVGDTVDYTITVEHHSTSDGSPIDITSVNDSLGIVLSGPTGDDGDGLLEDGEVWTYTGSRTVLATDPQDLVNTVCVEGTDVDGDPVEDCDSTTTTIEHAPVLLVSKAADVASASVGDTVNYTVTVTHDPSSDGSPVNITDVSDSLGFTLSGPTGDDGDGWLESGETWTYTGSREVLPTDPRNLINEACAQGLDLDGDVVQDCDSETTTIEHTPLLLVEKSGDPAFAAVGDVIGYTITVRHAPSSDGSPVLNLDVVDSLGIFLSGPTGDDGDGKLESSEVWTYTGSREVLPDDPHNLINEVCADGVDLDGDAVSDCGSTTTTIEHAPLLLVEKSGDLATASVGDTVNYTITVQHAPGSDGSPILSLDVVDSLGIVLSGPAGDDGDSKLEAGEIWTYTGSRVVMATDPRNLVNEVCATGEDLDGDGVNDCDDTTTTIEHEPVLLVEKVGDPAAVAIGDTVNYTITLTHAPTSDGSAVQITNVDDSLGIILAGPTGDDGDGWLEANETWTYTGSRVALVTDPHELVNTVCITGQDLEGDPVEDCDSTTTLVSHPDISLTKVADRASASIGQTIVYTYTVENTGDVDLYAVTLIDDVLGTIAGPASGDDGNNVLETDETWIYQKSHVVVEGDLPGPIVNVAEVTGTPQVGEPVSDTATESVALGYSASIVLEKVAADGPFVVGDFIDYNYTVTNNGNVTLTSVTLVDDVLGTITLGATTLAPGAFTTGTASHLVTQDDVDAGEIVNIAVTTGTPPTGPNVQDEDTETVTFDQNPSIDLNKIAAAGPFVVGDTIDYDYTVTNIGNVTLTSVTLVDDILGTITLTTTELAPGDSATGTASHLVTQDDVDAGSIVNVAVTTGTPPIGPDVQDDDTETVNFDQNPSIVLDKVAADGPFVVGDTIDYDYTVTNNGNVTLTSVTLIDDILGTITLTTTELAPGDSATGTASHLVTQDDMDAGEVVNEAIATGTPPSGPAVFDSDTETVGFDQNPSILLDKVAEAGSFVVGDTITYDYTVTNNGNVTLTSVTLVDDILGTITLTATELAPGDSATGTASHTVTQDDVDAGEIVNIAVATGTPPIGPNVQDDDTETVTLVQDPSIALDKVAEAGSFAVGDVITYDYTVTNNGNVTLTNVTLVDDILGTITLTGTELAPGDSVTGTASHTVTQDDVDAGQIVNIANATGTPPVGPAVEDEDTETVLLNQSASILVEKAASEGPFVVGDVITYDYTVTNNGNVTLTNVTLVDDILGTITLTGAELAPGASVTGTASHTVTQDDVDAGQIVNIATATGTAPDQSTVQDDDDVTVPFGQTASIDMDKTPSGGPYLVGEEIVYSYVVTNDGNVTLTNVTLVDDILGPITLKATELAPGASTTGTANHTVAQDDIDSGSITNVATTTGTAPDQSTVQDDDTVTVVLDRNPNIEVIKSAAEGPFAVGDSIDYSYVVTNTGNVTLTNVTLVDDILGTITLTGTELAPGASVTGTASHTVTQDDLDLGEIINIATTTGTAPDQSTVQDNDTETVTFDQNPLLTIEKTGDAGPVKVGETINYSIVVTNSGNVTLHNVQVDDPLLSISQGLGTMAPGDSQTLNASYGPVLEQHIPGITNTAVADSDETNPVQDDHTVAVEEVRIDLELIKTVSDPFPEVGSIVTFTITLSNAEGYADATGVAITDYLPVGYSYAGPFAASQGSFVPAGDGRSGLWSVGTLPDGSSATLSIPVIVEAVEDPVDYLSPAEVSSANEEDIDSVPANADVQPEDDDDVASIDLDTPLADLFVTKDVNVPTLFEGENATFTIAVYNGGPYPTTGVVLQDVLPTGLDYVSHDTLAGSYDPVVGTWNVGSLFVGESATLELTVLAAPGTADSTITNLATVTATDVPDPSDANNTDTASVTVLPIPETPEEPEGGGGATDECEGKVIISEIAWAGTAANPDHEWIELRNVGGEPVDVTGWILRWRKKDPVIEQDFEWKTIELYGELDASPVPACDVSAADVEPTVEFIKRETDAISWTVAARPINYDDSYMVLERQTDETISNIPADIIYDDVEPYVMEFTNEGDIIELLDAEGNVVDTANAFASYDGSWPAGDARTYGTMERIDPLGEDEPGNWHTNLGIVTYGLDAEGRPLVATSDVINSQTLEELELFADLNSTKTLPGARLEVGLDLPRSARLQSGWPWIRITRPGFDATAGGGGDDVSSAAPSYSFASRYANDLYWLGIDTAGLVPGDYLVWVVYGDGKTVLVPITVI